MAVLLQKNLESDWILFSEDLELSFGVSCGAHALCPTMKAPKCSVEGGGGGGGAWFMPHCGSFTGV